MVDIDIKGFFDNVNHRRLIKQLWNTGIQDRKVLRIISKMLKAPVAGEGIPSKGVPQGGILSPLLSNIALNDLDQWIAGQWHHFPTSTNYKQYDYKQKALQKTSKLKRGFIVRYADDFKILTDTAENAWKWFHAVKGYLKKRLYLDISPEKSKVVNLRRTSSDFLGITLKAIPNKKGKDGYTVRSKVKPKKKKLIITTARPKIIQLAKNPTQEMINKYNSFILGLHNYFKIASMVSIEFHGISHRLHRLMHNRLGRIGEIKEVVNPPPAYEKFYDTKQPLYHIRGTPLFPIWDVKFKIAYAFNQKLNIYTPEGIEAIHRKLKPNIAAEIQKLLHSFIPDRSIEYFDNRISRFSMAGGRCEITGVPLAAETYHCHHVIPLSQGGTDKFDNLRALHVETHRLLHATDPMIIAEKMNFLNVGKATLKKINKYRKALSLEMINT